MPKVNFQNISGASTSKNIVKIHKNAHLHDRRRVLAFYAAPRVKVELRARTHLPFPARAGAFTTISCHFHTPRRSVIAAALREVLLYLDTNRTSSTRVGRNRRAYEPRFSNLASEPGRQVCALRIGSGSRHVFPAFIFTRGN